MLWKKPMLLALFALSLNASAETLTGPLHGNTLALADRQASIYYTVHNNRFEVVTTIGDGEGDLLRFVAGIGEGEQQQIVLGGYGEDKRHTSLILSRSGDAIMVTTEDHAKQYNQQLNGVR